MYFFNFNTDNNEYSQRFDFTTQNDSLIFPIQSNFLFSSENMTDSSNINEINKKHLELLSSKNDFFVNLLLHTDFEDGMDNKAIAFVEKNINENVFATYLWLSNLYNLYSRIHEYDMNRNLILAGILRIFSYISGNSYLRSIEPTLLGLIKSALSDSNLVVKEAGVMVIEELRDKESLELLKQFNFKGTLIEKYVKTVTKELEEELDSVEHCA